MSTEIDGEIYLSLEEATEKYGWPGGTLYYFRARDYLNSYKFIGDKRTYWRVSELEAVKNRPPEVTKKGPKEDRAA